MMKLMQSPFPGMDPYLEMHWLDVHGALIAETRRLLNRSLPQGLVARMEERVAIDGDDGRELRVGPDVFVYNPAAGPWDQPSGGAMVIDAPFKLVVDLQPVIQRYIRIINQDGQLITVIEFVSPSNKRGDGLDAFQTKRSELLGAGVHVVEIDLVRAGDWRMLLQPHVCPVEAEATYRVTVRPGGNPSTAYLYPIRLQHTLPEIQIPLRKDDPRLMLPLQPMIETIYADGRYGMTLDYSRPLDPPLSADDRRFVTECVAAKVAR
jgi:hypothetical protein